MVCREEILSLDRICGDGYCIVILDGTWSLLHPHGWGRRLGIGVIRSTTLSHIGLIMRYFCSGVGAHSLTDVLSVRPPFIRTKRFVNIVGQAWGMFGFSS